MKFSAQQYFLIVACWAAGLILTAEVSAQEQSVRNEEAAARTDFGVGLKQGKFDYQVNKRPDPFAPFISIDTARIIDDENEIIDDDSDNGMEPGQLRLVALMGKSDGILAMVEDAGGKGYILRKGMLIGKRGQIIGIEKDRVIIRETAKTKAGREISNEVVMSLKKEEKK